MKKVIILLVALFGASMLVHAVTGQRSPPQAPAANPQQPAAAGQQSPSKNDTEKVDNGSGDDIDTVDEGDPANDKDPEADDTSTAPGKS